ncbi:MULTISPECIES: hypothetical protein [unclassified Psychrobacter]|uniref:hypothetical protein n=1 Tax=unclassified Psychrobacter TaxID=196806 RepID=UPI0025B5A52B|nr:MULTISPECIES: hypothetical protein [unclassified Psychrobacter]MDN3452097.1 hypothetical protein [Psychrobacter sp. APC 3350]MDN3503290.1 hypothetical protein [Psychrobacter sp. 5A.1]
MITLGNTETIAFKIHEMEKPFIVMDIIVNSVNISYQDNNYYAFPLVNNIKKEIELITDGEFHLNKSLINKPLSKLHDIFYETETGAYDSSSERTNFLFYDLSTNKSLFYVYQEDECLKFFDSNNTITSRIKKSEFLATLLKLLHTVESYAAPRNI